MFRKVQYNIAKFFNFPIEPERNYRVQNMKEVIGRLGGELNFHIQRNEDGWSAECQEIKGIITGGTVRNPTSAEINDNIRDAVFSAFGIPPYACKDQLLKNTKEVILEERRVFA